MTKPTIQIYSELQQAFDHFNKEIFASKLPECILLLYNKEHRVMGYFTSNQFVSPVSGKYCDAIAMNPMHFATRQIVEVMQTVVHEMVHLWQHHFGEKNSLKVYHNKEWADKMESVGLMPSDTGKPGGKKTGQSMGDYPIKDGLFLQSCDRLLTAKYRISWVDRFSISTGNIVSTLETLGIEESGETPEKPEKPKPNKTNRVKYTCPDCAVNIWAKPSLNVICGDCDTAFIPESD